jgi:hypothetical protein
MGHGVNEFDIDYPGYSATKENFERRMPEPFVDRVDHTLDDWREKFSNFFIPNNDEQSASTRAAEPLSDDYYGNLAKLGQGGFNRKRRKEDNSESSSGSSMLDKFNMGGNILGGIGDLASGWAALQRVGVARKSQQFKEDAWRQNMARQKTTVNNPIRMQQAVLNSDFYNDPARANALKLVT